MVETASRRLFIAGATALSLVPAVSVAESASTLKRVRANGVLRVGWAIYYPNLFRDPKTNALSGVMVDYAALIGKALGVKIAWIEDNTATLIAGLQANKFDITTPLGITKPRARATTFAKPLIREGLALLALRKKIGERAKWQDYNVPGTRISVTLGSNSDLQVTRLFTKADIVRVRSESDSLAMVLSGRVDAKATGRSALRLLLSQRSEIAEVRNSVFHVSPMAVAIRKGDNEFRAWLDQFTSEQKKNGNIVKILKKYGLDETFMWPDE
jgi:polar amino acid transport system substrate-binding protein